MLVDIALVVFALFLYIICAVLTVLEIFIPSFGLLTLLALGAFAWATVVLFQMGTAVGWAGLAAAAIVIPSFWIVTYKLFPKTSVGRSMILKNATRQVNDINDELHRLKQLVGKSGTALGPLRPVGICEIDGQRISCSAEVGFVPKGADVEVIRVEGNLVTVRVKETNV